MTSPSETVLEARQLGKTYQTPAGPLTVLSEASFALRRGDIAAIVGPSGSGKSTLLALMAGLDTASTGEALLMGKSWASMTEDGRALWRGKHVAMVFQNFQLLPGLTAEENVSLPMELRGESGAVKRARDLLDRVGLGQRLDHFPVQLSGGEQQRVALARAFAARPDVLFADEPTGNLDTSTSARVVELLFELHRDTGATVVLVTHDPALAAKTARQFHMDAGRLREAVSVSGKESGL